MSSLTLKLDTVHLSDEQFYEICQNNREVYFQFINGIFYFPSLMVFSGE